MTIQEEIERLPVFFIFLENVVRDKGYMVRYNLRSNWVEVKRDECGCKSLP